MSTQDDPTSPQLSKHFDTIYTIFYKRFSKNHSPTTTNDNSSFKQLFTTHQNELPNNTSRHPSQNQSILPNTSFDRKNKSQYNLRHQPKKDYRLFLPPSNFEVFSHYIELNENW